MNKKYILRKNEEIQEIIKKSKKVVNKFFVIYYTSNDKNYNRYCVSINNRFGKANVRNLFKRRIKDILMKNNINNSHDYVIILRNSVLEVDYHTLQNELINLLKGEI